MIVYARKAIKKNKLMHLELHHSLLSAPGRIQYFATIDCGSPGLKAISLFSIIYSVAAASIDANLVSGSVPISSFPENDLHSAE